MVLALAAAVARAVRAVVNYNFITQEVTSKLGEANKALIMLLDKIRRLDNDLIRIKSKLNTILTIREEQDKKNKD